VSTSGGAAAEAGAALEKSTIHPALYRPVLYAGVAPQFLFVEACAVFLLLFEAGIHLATCGLCLFYCLVFHPLAVHLCARHPMIAELYVRSLRGRDFYSALPALEAAVPAADPALPNVA
jgi:type IV secretory pathway TrbD component